MEKNQYILLSRDMAPAVMLSVLEVKRLLTTGEAESISQAIKQVGISRSVFYKYKDSVFEFGQKTTGRMVTLLVTLRDRPGVLSQVISEIYRLGGNILTLNQNMPMGDVALVNISVRTDHLTVEEDLFLKSIRRLEGVKNIVSFDNESGKGPSGE